MTTDRQKTGISTIDEPQDIKYLQGALAKTKQQLLDSELVRRE